MSREKFGKIGNLAKNLTFFWTFVYGQQENLFFSQKTHREGKILVGKNETRRIFTPLGLPQRW